MITGMRLQRKSIFELISRDLETLSVRCVKTDGTRIEQSFMVSLVDSLALVK